MNIVVDIVVSIGLYKPLGIAGLIIGTVVANAVMTALQLHRLRIGFNGRLEGGADGDDHRAHPARLGAARGRLVGGVDGLLDSLLGTSLLAQIVSVGAAALAGLLVYMRAVLVMRRARGPPGGAPDPRAVRPRMSVDALAYW